MPTLKLLSVDPSRVPEFSFAGRFMTARLVEIHDGDTAKVLFEYAGTIVKVTVRFEGVDTAELRSKSQAERDKAVRARDFVAAWALPDRFKVGGNHSEKEIREALAATPVLITVRCGKFEKFGRTLATLFKPPAEESLNKQLLDSGLAVKYDGGTKEQGTFS